MELLPLLLILVAGALLFTSYRRGARQNRVMQQAQAELAPGQEVQTTSGLYATVVEVGPEIVVLQTGPEQYVRWNKAAIRNVVPTEAEPAPVGDEEGPPSAISPAGD